MKNFSLKALFDSFFIAFIVFLITFTLSISHLGRVSTTIIAVFFSLVSFTFFVYRFTSKEKRARLSRAERVQSKRFNEFLSIIPVRDCYGIIMHGIKNTYPKGLEEKGSFLIQEKKERAFFRFSFEGLKKSDVVYAFNHIKPEETAVIYCYHASEEGIAFAKKFNGKVNIKTGEDLYAEIKNGLSFSLLPRTFFSTNKIKRKFFTKKNALKFLLFGALFYFMSSFVTIKIYYVIFGTAFLIFSLLSFLFGKKT